MVYSAAEAQKARSKRRPEQAYSETRAIVSLDDRRYVLDGPTATLGRSKECDCVIDDPNAAMAALDPIKVQLLAHLSEHTTRLHRQDAAGPA